MVEGLLLKTVLNKLVLVIMMLIENDNCSVDIHITLNKMRSYVSVNEHWQANGLFIHIEKTPLTL